MNIQENKNDFDFYARGFKLIDGQKFNPAKLIKLASNLF